MILPQLYNNNIFFEEVSTDSTSINILTRPIYQIEVDASFNSVIYTSKEIKSILINKINNVPEQFIVTVPFNQWTDVFKIQENEYRLAGLDLATVSLHFMILIENQTNNEVYLYTGDFFTIEKLKDNLFFKELVPKINKIFFDNKTIKHDIKTHMEIISTFIKQKIDNYSVALCLPHLGYEDFIAALIKNFNMTVHVNELRKFLLQTTIDTTEGALFIDNDGEQPKLIVHSKSKSLTEIKKLYFKYNICTLSFSHLNEFDGGTPKIVDYYLTMLQWDQHPTESMILELFQMLPEHIGFNLIYDKSPCSMAIRQYLCTNALEDSFNYAAGSNLSPLNLSNLDEADDYQIIFTQNSEFSPQFFSSQFADENRPQIPIEVNHVIEIVESEGLSISEDDEEGSNLFCIEDFEDLDLGSDFKCIRFTGKKSVS